MSLYSLLAASATVLFIGYVIVTSVLRGDPRKIEDDRRATAAASVAVLAPTLDTNDPFTE